MFATLRRGLGLIAAFFVCATGSQAAWSAEAGGPFVRTFTPRNYGASPQNWAAIQDRRGVLYFGNTGGVLEYDGVNWRQITVGKGLAVRSLAVDEKGTVYVGSQGEFGYLRPDASGSLRYASLLDRVPADARKFGDVWTIFPAKEGIWFGSYQEIFRLPPDGGQASVWKPVTRFGRMLNPDGAIYVTSGEGLLQFRDGAFRPVPGGKEFGPQAVRGLFATSRGLELMTLTAIYRDDGSGFQKVSNAIEPLLTSSVIYTAQPLDAGELALATSRGGLILLGADRRVDRILNKESGLLSNSITSVFRDREGALWLTSDAGIERLELSMTRFASAQGLEGNAYNIARQDWRLYAATTVGLFRLETERGEGAHFTAIPGFRESLYALTPSPHGLLAGGDHGVHTIGGGQEVSVLKKALILDIGLSPTDPNRAWAAGRTGLFELTWDGRQWQPGRSLASKSEEFRSVTEDHDGRVWVGGRDFVLRVSWDGSTPTTERYASGQGIPAGLNNIYWWRGATVFATSKGLLRFDGSKFVPASGIPAGYGRPAAIVREAADGRTWLTGAGHHEIIRGDSVFPMPLLRSEQTELYAVLPEADGTVWASGADGFLIRYETPREAPAVPFKIGIRRIKPQNGSDVFEGGGDLAAVPRLPYRNNTLRFEFAAPFFEDPSKVEYQVHLDGADSDWSRWSTEPRKDYTHLFEGSYGFEVRARNPHGEISQIATFNFNIQPPWYRTWMAWLAYALMAAAALWGLYRWRIRKLVAEKQKLEITVAERTVEIRQQRDQIQMEQERGEALLLNILPASVATELKSTGAVKPQQYDDVTVCFTDFVGFTLSSESIPAAELVSSLHEYFTNFDEITEEYGLEKLKTIGDSYMLVSGLPKPRRGHAVNAVLAALRMVEVVEELAHRGDGAVWGVRIGLNTGPVSAGVVGVRKFAYDIWGNTVNMASRMESSGEPGRVNLSQSTYELVRDFIECEPRGRVLTKDKRTQEMYFAVGLRRELATGEAFAELYRRRFEEEPVVIPKLRARSATASALTSGGN